MKKNFFPHAPEGTEQAVLALLKKCEIEDDYIRTYQIANWKRNENYSAGVQNIFWSENLGDWVIASDSSGLRLNDSDSDGMDEVYDYVINIFGPHEESIIAALASDIPYVEFFPDDSDDIDQISEAKARTKLGLIIQKHNKAKLKLMQILFNFCNQGLACIYRYQERDKAYGTTKIPKYDKVKKSYSTYICSSCGKEGQTLPTEQATDIGAPCEDCQGQTFPLNPEEKEETKIVGQEDFPQARECWDILGPINVKVPYYAREQKEFGYLIHYFDKNIAELKDTYEDFRDDITADAAGAKERWARVATSYSLSWTRTTEDTNLAFVKKAWFRPFEFELIENDIDHSIIDYLKKKFSKGLFITVINNKIVDAYAEGMDDCWRVGKAGISSFIHSNPLLQNLVPIQDMKNQLSNLTIETIEHGVPSLFADTDYVDFDKYRQQPTLPGTMTPAKAPPGKSLQEGFYEQKLATPSKEIEVTANRLDEDAQFTTHDYPSIYGGPSEGKSRTLGEYQQSGQKAMQSLGIAYEYLKDLWAEIVMMSVDAHVDEMKTFNYDASATSRISRGNFKTMKVKASDFTKGKHFYAEASEGFPISSAAKKQLLLQLMQLQIPSVQTVIDHPENGEQIAESFGFPELYIPTQAQRFKALAAIRILSQGEPIQMPNVEQPDQPDNFLPSIEPEPEIDDEALQIEVFKVFLASEEGQQLRKDNPAGYMNCKSYLKVLQSLLEAKTMNQFEQSPAGVSPRSNLS